MKELSIEEKAKRYDETLENARKELQKCGSSDCDAARQIFRFFPELKENENELTWLTKYIKEEAYSLSMDIRDDEDRIKLKNLQKSLAWLEKQNNNKLIWKHWSNGIAGNGEGKLIYLIKEGNNYRLSSCLSFKCDYIELSELDNLMLEKQDKQKSTIIIPKFKVGDWVVSPNGVYYHIDAVRNGRYEVTTNAGNCCNWPLDTEIYHLWTIKDAEDGDILAVENMIFIFKTVLASHIVSYCKLFNDKFDHFRDGRTCCEGNSNVHPATKEQCDALIKAMNDAGYTFDFEKKELKKIEAEELTEQKHAGWSEEDKEYLAACIEVIDNFYTLSGELKKLTKINVLRREYAEKLKSWLKSLKPQSKYEQEESVLHW